MRITFILPGSSRHPVGGYNAVFQYANGLSKRGNEVTVVHPAMLDPTVSWLVNLYHMGRYVLWAVTGKFGPERWFDLVTGVKLLWIPSLRESYIPPADAIVATGWPTAEFVATYSADKGRKFYFIQHYETWWGPEPRVRATWRLPLTKIVIAHWLEKIAAEMGQETTYIPCGFDFRTFGCDIPIRNRKQPCVLMLCHKFEWKGAADGIEALEIARRAIPDLKATMFSVYPRPADLPSWIEYVRKPTQKRLRELYNEAAVFLAPSWTEGWPAPPAEAMISGAAVVCTDIPGHREYIAHERNALMAPAKDPDALGSALVRMLTDHELRHALAERAQIEIRRFTWESAVERFESELSGPSETGKDAIRR